MNVRILFSIAILATISSAFCSAEIRSLESFDANLIQGHRLTKFLNESKTGQYIFKRSPIWKEQSANGYTLLAIKWTLGNDFLRIVVSPNGKENVNSIDEPAMGQGNQDLNSRAFALFVDEFKINQSTIYNHELDVFENLAFNGGTKNFSLETIKKILSPSKSLVQMEDERLFAEYGLTRAAYIKGIKDSMGDRFNMDDVDLDKPYSWILVDEDVAQLAYFLFGSNFKRPMYINLLTHEDFARLQKVVGQQVASLLGNSIISQDTAAKLIPIKTLPNK